MKWITGLALVLLIAVCTACAPPLELTDEQIQSLSFIEIPGAYAIDDTFTGVVTYQSLMNEGSVQTAKYVKSVEGLQIYRSAFKATTSAAGPLIIWNWVLVYENERDADGYFSEHALLYPDATEFSSSFPRLAQQSTADYTTSDNRVFQLSHVIMRERNIVIYEAMLYKAGAVNEEEVQKYAQLLETNLLDAIKSQ